MRLYLICFLFLSFCTSYSQDKEFNVDTSLVKIDSLYREDQFYFGIIYNSLLDKPQGVSQEKISVGLSLGFLRDMPINKKRTFAIAPGIGISYNNFYQNLAITGTNQAPIFNAIPGNINFSKNKFEQFFVDVPIEFRWRNSTPESYKFWRIYGGVKFSYLLLDKSIYVDDQTKTVIKNNTEFNSLIYGAYFSIGYNTINFHVYYGLNNIFKSSAKVNNESIAMSNLGLGIMFYIL